MIDRGPIDTLGLAVVEDDISAVFGADLGIHVIVGKGLNIGVSAHGEFRRGVESVLRIEITDLDSDRGNVTSGKVDLLQLNRGDLMALHPVLENEVTVIGDGARDGPELAVVLDQTNLVIDQVLRRVLPLRLKKLSGGVP